MGPTSVKGSSNGIGHGICRAVACSLGCSPHGLMSFLAKVLQHDCLIVHIRTGVASTSEAFTAHKQRFASCKRFNRFAICTDDCFLPIHGGHGQDYMPS